MATAEDFGNQMHPGKPCRVRQGLKIVQDTPRESYSPAGALGGDFQVYAGLQYVRLDCVLIWWGFSSLKPSQPINSYWNQFLLAQEVEKQSHMTAELRLKLEI